MTDHLASFRALGTTATVVTTQAAALDPAVDAVRAELARFDATCSRFRPDSELMALNAAAGRAVVVSPLLLLAVQTGAVGGGGHRRDRGSDPRRVHEGARLRPRLPIGSPPGRRCTSA